MIVVPMRAPRLRDQVYDALKAMLRDGTFPDTRWREEELAGTLGVSRTPVREALFQLCREGFLEDTGRGFRRPELTAEDVREIVELRRLLEPAIGRTIATTAEVKTKRSFKTIVAREAEALPAFDPASFIAANGAFRALFLGSCGNRQMAQVMQAFDDRIGSLRRQTLGPLDNRRATLVCHKDFLAALDKSDPDAAAAAVNGLLDAASTYYATIW